MGSSSDRIGAGDSSRSAGDDTIDAVREVEGASQETTPARPEGSSYDYPDLLEVDPSHYVIGEPIGRGGMGQIVAARDRRFGRSVAIKQIRPDSPAARHRFEQEARITAGLQHPGIVNVHEAGVWPSGAPFYAMKHVVGRSLDRVIAGQKSLKERLALLPHAMAVCDAVAYAHSRKVIHRDLKPSNVLVGEFGETVIIDWGLAKDLSAAPARRMSRPIAIVSESDATGDGEVVGTPAYMPPEQARGETVDKRADVYALGAILYAMMAGEAPYVGASSKAILDQVASAPPIPLDERQPGVPADLLAIVSKAMARRPEARYLTAQELAVDLRRFQNGQLVSAYRYSRRERFWRVVRRYRVAVIVGGVALMALTLVAGVSISRILDERETAQTQRASAEKARREADEARARATRQAVALLAESGRQELRDGKPGRALPYLVAALEGDDASPALQLLITEARRSFDAQEKRIEAHKGRVAMAQFSSDGAHIVSAGQDNTARIYDDTGRLLVALAHDAPVSFASFGPESDRVVTVAGNSARLWSLEGQPLVEMAHDGPVYHAAFSDSGDRVVTSSADGTGAVWDTRSGQRVAHLSAHEDQVLHAELSLDGSRVVTASKDGTAILWSADGAQQHVLDGHTGPVLWASFSTDLPGSRVVTSSADGTARTWNASTGKLIAVLQGHSGEVLSAQFRLDDEQIVTASRDRTARVWAPDTGALVATLAGHSDVVLSAEYGSNQTRIVTASSDGSVRVWNSDAETMPLLLEGHAGAVASASFSPEGRRIVSAGNDGTVRLWKADDPRRLQKITTRTGQVGSVAFDPSGTRLVTGSSDKTARIWSASDGKQLLSIEDLDSTVFDAQFSNDGGKLAITGADGAVRLHTLEIAADGALVSAGAMSLEGHDKNVYAAAFSPDGSHLATGGADATVRLWDVATGKQVLVFSGHARTVTSVSFSPSGDKLLTASTDRTVAVWDTKRGERRTVIDARATATSAAFSPDARRIVVGGANGAEIFEAGGAVLYTLEGAGFVYKVAFSSDGSLVATAGEDRTARIWDAESGKLLAMRRGQTNELLSLAFSPDGTALATASRDGTVVIWDIRRGATTYEEISGSLERYVPWCLANGRLLPIEPGQDRQKVCQ